MTSRCKSKPASRCLIIDGEDRESKGPRAQPLHQAALSPEARSGTAKKPRRNRRSGSASFTAEEFTVEQMQDDPPRALILNNVPSLTDEQQKLVEGFLEGWRGRSGHARQSRRRGGLQ